MIAFRQLATTLLLATTAPVAAAEPPRVAADILPVHGLVARVMEGVGVPDLVLPPGASPHGHAMRPSEAAALEAADLVFWVGPSLTPWLEGPLGAVADDARIVALLDAGGTHRLPFREAGDFDAADAHGDHAEAHGDDHDLGAGGTDPHAWLDPGNGKAWLGVIADALAEADPENAARYRANAEAGVAEIDARAAGIDAALEPLRATPFLVFHDATQYFEAHFGLHAAGALSLGDGVAPGPATVARIRDTVATAGIACLFTEPGVSPGLVEAVLAGSDARAVALDPLGRDIAPGPGFYDALLAALGTAFAACG